MARASDLARVVTIQHDYSVDSCVVFMVETPPLGLCRTTVEAVMMDSNAHLPCTGKSVGCNSRAIHSVSDCTMDNLEEVWKKWLSA